MKGSAMSSQVVEPYAEALMALAQDTQKIDVFAEDTRSLLAALEDSKDFRAFVANPLLKAEEKKAVLSEICGRDTDPYFLNFLLLLVDRRRIAFLEAICQQFIALQRKLNNVVLAEVTTAAPLRRSQKEAIADRVKSLTDASNVELKITEDANLIGGVVIKVGSQVFDASLRGQLRRIGMDLLGAS